MEFMTALRGSFDDQKPSLFELISEQQLNSLLPPTIRYLLTVATQRYPRYLLRALNSFDELYALCMLVVERHYLKTRGGSFTEHFYGLKRERALHAEIPRASASAPHIVRDTLKLTTKDVWMNLAVMVGIPYLKRKLDEGYEVNAPRALLGAAYTQMPPNPTWKQRFLHYYRWFLRNVYPSVNAAYYFALLSFNLAYLFDNSKYHNPFMWLINTRVRRMTGADYQAIDALTSGTPAKGGAPPGWRSLFSPREMGPRLLSSLSMLLPMSIFALKFLEWWHASDGNEILAKQRLHRPISPHLTIYKMEQTWFGASIWTRITGGGLSAAFYVYFGTYLVAPLLGWHVEAASLVSAAAAAPVALKAGLKFLVAWPFTFHFFNGIRHLTYDFALGFAKPEIIKWGWVIWSTSLVSALGLAFAW